MKDSTNRLPKWIHVVLSVSLVVATVALVIFLENKISG